jgi:hypothetical protein
MSWWAFVYGEIEMSPDGEKDWRKLRVEPTRFGDWPEEFHVDGGDSVHVGRLLNDLKSMAKDAWVHVVRDGGRVRVTGFLHEDAYLEFEVPLAVAFRSASMVGGAGEIVMGDFQLVDFGWRIRVAPGKSSVSTVPERGRAKLLEKVGAALAAEAPKAPQPRPRRR